MELKSGLCQMVSQGAGSYKFLDGGASNGSAYMSNDSKKRGTFWLVRPQIHEGFPTGIWMFEQPSPEGQLSDSISGSGVYLVTRMESFDWYPNPQPYIAMGDDVANAHWMAETYNSAPGCFNFRSQGYLNGNPGDSTPWRYQVSLGSYGNAGETSWKIIYTPKG
ncbi:MAG TPA: hypothetical protein PLS93_19085 [Accumulibacter sp.]|jgi:hypothetical protein|uniref:hypothetical protein n=1 Tax=Candidatus Accumulibacter sp. ACC005 TaxID=2823331 RepID=UPI0025C582E1|nr:hypothetical protein [Candidatus Accumulibacter sp. ACC005]HRI93734.1 hypothetical protein [Accumulibacter sp.]